MIPLLLLLLFCCLVKTDKELQSGLEPGHEKQEYDSVEEVRGHESTTETEKPTEDEHLMREAILDVAYYLRRFKFSGYDPRYLAEGEIPKQNLFVEFPSPPLRNIHWEVKKNCEPSFSECVKYLQEQVSQTVLPRHLDSLTITKQNGWSFITDRDLIKGADDECLKLLKSDTETFTVFSGPLQRFQWLTSASYYMCMYAMKETLLLRNFTEDCDNYASCIQWDFNGNNKDIRANNNRPFACAFYSFCPDPCCPMKHLSHRQACYEASPCYDERVSNSTCSFLRHENVNFESMILNQWNVSCNCDQPGLRWESKSGMCVDIDECFEKDYPCYYPRETCKNLPGSYKCVCSPLGYRNDRWNETCLEDPVLHNIFFPSHPTPKNETKLIPIKFTDIMHSVMTKIKSAVTTILLKKNTTEPNVTEQNQTETDSQGE